MCLRWQCLRWHSQQEDVTEQKQHGHCNGVPSKNRFLLQTAYLQESLDHPSAHPSRFSFHETRALVDTPLGSLYRRIIKYLRQKLYRENTKQSPRAAYRRWFIHYHATGLDIPEVIAKGSARTEHGRPRQYYVSRWGENLADLWKDMFCTRNKTKRCDPGAYANSDPRTRRNIATR